MSCAEKGIVNKVNRVNTATALLLILCFHHYMNNKIFIKLTHMFYIIPNMIISTQTSHTESIYTEVPRRVGAKQKYLRIGRAKRKYLHKGCAKRKYLHRGCATRKYACREQRLRKTEAPTQNFVQT